MEITGEPADELIGVAKPKAARIIGVSIQRLNRWMDSGLIEPAISAQVGRRTVVSFGLEDLVQGRLVRALEELDVHILAIRHVVDGYRRLGHPEPLRELEWAVDNGQVFVRASGGSWEDGRRPGQQVIPKVLDLHQIRTEARKAVRERAQQDVGRVVRTRGVMGSKPVFAGTRIPVATVHTYLTRGYSTSAILDEYPDLRPGDIEEARRLLAS